jgi:virginiamycin B lyase
MAIEEAQGFTADGPVSRAFQTAATNAEYGVNVQGTTAGVYGESMEHSPDTRAAPTGTGVFGQGDSAGVIGVSSSPSDVAYPASGPGVLGWSSHNRGGVFASGNPAQPPLAAGAFPAASLVAQVHLVPAETDGRPPLVGLAGDLFVALDPTSGLATLWFCLRSSSATNAALWTQFQSSAGVTASRLRGSITEYALPTPNSFPFGIAVGPDGAFWFTEAGSNRIGRITLSGAIAEYPLPWSNSYPVAIVLGPDPDRNPNRNLWFTEYSGNRIGRITPDGEIAEYPLPHPNSGPGGIAVGPDGALWFTELTGNRIGRITPDGEIAEYTLPPDTTPPDSPSFGGLSGPYWITGGPDGNLWFTEARGDHSKIGSITPRGEITEYPLPGTSTNTPWYLTAGSDGAVWFTESNSYMGRITLRGSTPGGEITEYPLPPSSVIDRGMGGIVTGPDGNLWFTEQGLNGIGRMISPTIANDYPIPMPGSYPLALAFGPDGNLWFTEAQGNRIGCLAI